MNGPDPYADRARHFALAGGARTLRVIVGGLLLIELAWILVTAILMPWPAAGTGTAFRSFAVLMSFLVMGGATVLVTHRLQKRGPVTLIGPLDRARHDAKRVIGAITVLLVVLYGVQGGWETVSQAMPVARWLLLLPFACLAVLVQTGAEELLYRGYFQQSLGARFDHPAVWMVLPSILFGASHYDPGVPVDMMLAQVIWITAFGLAAADLTARTGSLGAAIGMHFAHNLPLVVLVTEPGMLSGLSLFHYPLLESVRPPPVVGLFFQLFYLWMVWMAARIAIRR